MTEPTARRRPARLPGRLLRLGRDASSPWNRRVHDARTSSASPRSCARTGWTRRRFPQGSRPASAPWPPMRTGGRTPTRSGGVLPGGRCRRADWATLLDRFYEVDFGTIGEGVARTRPRRARWTRSRTRAIRSCWPRCPCSRAARWSGGSRGRASTRACSRGSRTSRTPPRETQALLLRREPGRSGLRGADVLMVGNNTVEDLGVRSLGHRRFPRDRPPARPDRRLSIWAAPSMAR